MIQSAESEPWSMFSINFDSQPNHESKKVAVKTIFEENPPNFFNKIKRVDPFSYSGSLFFNF